MKIVMKTIKKLVPDDKATGMRARHLRLDRQLGLREVARMLGCSATHICDLEQGRRTWAGKVAAAYARLLTPTHSTED